MTQESTLATEILDSIHKQPIRDQETSIDLETRSINDRQSEPQAIQIQTASASDFHHFPGIPRKSRFKEEFNTITGGTRASERRSFNLTWLVKHALKSNDGTAVEDLLDVPMPDFVISARRDQSPRGSYQPYDDEDVSIKWSKAVAAHETKRKSQDDRRKHIWGGQKMGSLGELWQFDSRKAVQKEASERLSPAEQYNKRLEEHLAAKKLVMNDWEAELEGQARQAKTNSKSTISKVSRSSEPDRRFPSSWSRFPSHKREKRCPSAGSVEGVEHHDFVSKTDAGEKTISYSQLLTNDRAIDDDREWLAIEQIRNCTRKTIVERVSQVLHSIEMRGGGRRALENQTRGRRGSMVVAGKVEYPELELLPITPGRATIQSDPLKHVPHIEDEKVGHRKDLTAENGNNNDRSHESKKHTITDEPILSISDPRFYDDCINQTLLK